MRIQCEHTRTQCEEGARDVNTIRVKWVKLLVGVETQGGFFFFSHALHLRFVVVSGASVAFVVVVVVVVVVGLEVGGAVFGKVIALLVVSAGFGVRGGAVVDGFDAMFIVFLSPLGPYKRNVKDIGRWRLRGQQ